MTYSTQIHTLKKKKEYRRVHLDGAVVHSEALSILSLHHGSVGECS